MAMRADNDWSQQVCMNDKERITVLQAENERLSCLLRSHGIDPVARLEHVPGVTQPSLASSPTTAEKVSLFRALFAGRHDLFAVRWESASTNRNGYSPACANEWRPGICQKPQVKCAECAHRQFEPLADRAIYQHLTGERTIGTYPLRPDNTCPFLAVDFDSGAWQDDALAFVHTCNLHEVPSALEISRSGQGAHVWIFFSEPVAAQTARQLGAALISHTCARTRQLELNSYDRMFPSQDVMPKGGFGNLIALPLQKSARQRQCSVFVDEHWQPYPDQWAFLQGLARIDAQAVRTLIASVSGGRHPLDVSFLDDQDEARPWQHQSPEPINSDEPLPECIEMTMANQLYFRKSTLPQSLMNRLIRLAAFQNPAFYRAQALRLSVWDKPRIIGCAQNYPEYIALPRGCLEAVQTLSKDNNIQLRISDERFQGEPVAITFRGRLRAEQAAAVAALREHEVGVLSAPTGFGKTVTAAAMIAERGTNALVLVHRTELLRQWVEQLQALFGSDSELVGSLGQGRARLTGTIDVATVQSLARHGEVNTIVQKYGHVLIDECHHVAAVSFEAILSKVQARYVLGLTATPYRRDGHQPIIFMQCGPIRYKAKETNFSPEQLEVLPYRIDTPLDQGSEVGIQDLFRHIAQDAERIVLTAKLAGQSFESRRKILVLTERADHLEAIENALHEQRYPVLSLHGRMPKKQRQAALETLKAMPEDAPRIVLATGRLVGEGFDHAPLDTLILAMPVSWKGTLKQYVGRLHRLQAGKTNLKIIDLVDAGHPALLRMWHRRQTGYRAMGYNIRNFTDYRQQAMLQLLL